jgi:hypothetical protein
MIAYEPRNMGLDELGSKRISRVVAAELRPTAGWRSPATLVQPEGYTRSSAETVTDQP